MKYKDDKKKTEMKSILALEKFKTYNCCQSVLSSFAGDLQLEEAIALKISGGFGGGMACGETCGAVTGAYMVIGMKQVTAASTGTQKTAIKEKIREFNLYFIEKHGSLICKELLGANISTPEGQALAREKDVFNKLCPRFIETACNILEQKF